MTLLCRPVNALLATTLTGFLLFSSPQTVFSAPPPSATLSPNGDLAIRRGDTDSIATIHAGIFEPGWAYRSAGFDATSKTARISATTAGSIVTVKPTITTEGKTIRVSVTFTADKDTPVNSAHVSVNLPMTAYVGGSAVWKGNEGTRTFVLPASPGATRIMDGNNGSLRVTDKAGTNKVSVAVTGDTGLLLQDGRVFGGVDLEVRIGAINEHILKAGQPETVSFTVELADPVAVEEEKPLTLQAGPDWIPLSPKSLDIVPGSALDFAPFLADAPAGKYGPLIVRPDGHFGFARQNKAQRFYGVNLCFSANYLAHSEADALAERLQRLGYNSVRIHHYEGDLIDQSASDSLTFRTEQLDKLDYLVAALKKRGIYITTDLFVSRPVKPAEMGLTEGSMDDFKDAVLVSKPAMANWKAFSKKLLTHVNPYTKLAYKDEPTLAWIALINEPNLTNGRLGAWKGKLRELFEGEWKTWYATQYRGKAAPPLPSNLPTDDTGRDIATFFAFLHQRGWNEMSGFLRKEIGTKALLTYMNGWSETPAFMTTRQSFDFVDNHFYWDHPNFLGASWGLPSTGWSGNGSAAAAGGAGPDTVAKTRIPGKPFTVSEWDYVFPNRYRAEGSLIMGARSAEEDWDAIWHFAYSHGRDSVVAPRPADYFNMAQDPLRQASERTGILLFLRRDMTTFAYQKTQPVPITSSAPPNVPWEILKEEGIYLVSLPRTYGAVFTKPQAESTANGTPCDTTPSRVGAECKISNVQSAATITVSSLDSGTIRTSRHLLITHLTDLQNTNEKFATTDRRVLDAWGELPYLVRRGSATVRLARSDGKKLKAFRLDTNGKRVAPLPMQVTKDSITLKLSTRAPDGSATLYYEVITTN